MVVIHGKKHMISHTCQRGGLEKKRVAGLTFSRDPDSRDSFYALRLPPAPPAPPSLPPSPSRCLSLLLHLVGRLRLVLAVVILGLISLDGFSRPGMTTSQIVSEALAGLAGLALLVQALLDQRKEQAVQVRRVLVLVLVLVLISCRWLPFALNVFSFH